MWQREENQSKLIDTTLYNVGIPTGNNNNLIVLDIDFKNGGINEFNKYIEQYSEPQTLKISTPNGGFHYLILFNSSNDNDNFLIKNYLKNKSGYRNSGIDIRSEGGYIVAPLSIIDNKNYEVINDKTILEMPSTLISWLLLDTTSINNNKILI